LTKDIKSSILDKDVSFKGSVNIPKLKIGDKFVMSPSAEGDWLQLNDKDDAKLFGGLTTDELMVNTGTVLKGETKIQGKNVIEFGVDEKNKAMQEKLGTKNSQMDWIS
jgi:hypothetical protein